MTANDPLTIGKLRQLLKRYPAYQPVYLSADFGQKEPVVGCITTLTEIILVAPIPLTKGDDT